MLYRVRDFGLYVCNIYYELKIIFAKIYGFNIIASSDTNITTSGHKRCAIYTDEEKITWYYIHKFGKNNSSSISVLTFLKTLLCYSPYILNFITYNITFNLITYVILHLKLHLFLIHNIYYKQVIWDLLLYKALLIVYNTLVLSLKMAL